MERTSFARKKIDVSAQESDDGFDYRQLRIILADCIGDKLKAILEQMAMNDMQNTAFAIGSGCTHYIFAPFTNEPALRREWSTRAQQNR